MKLQETGCTSEECYVQLGKILLAKFILIGKIYKIEDNYFITINLIDVESAKIIYSDKNKVIDLANLDILCGKMTEKMLSSVLNVKSELTEDDYSIVSTYNNISGRVKEVIDRSAIIIDKGIIHGVSTGKICYVYSNNRIASVFIIDDINKNFSKARLIYYKKRIKPHIGDEVSLPYTPDKKDYIRNNHIYLSFNTSELLQLSYEMKRLINRKTLISPEVEFSMDVSHFKRFKLRLIGNINIFSFAFKLIGGISNFTYEQTNYYSEYVYNDISSTYDFNRSYFEKENKNKTVVEAGIGIKVTFFPTQYYNLIIGMNLITQNNIKSETQYITVYKRNNKEVIMESKPFKHFYSNVYLYFGFGFQF